MTHQSDLRIATLALHAGWSGGNIEIATAIALAESGGISDAIGDRSLETATWGPSVGLWQIRSLKAEYGTGKVRDEKANLNPEVNALHAYTIWGWAGGFTPWTTYNNGHYRAFWSRARAAYDELTQRTVLHRYLLLLPHWQTGHDVAACQRIIGCRADGVFGPITKEHVISWQRRKEILVDGIVGPQTAGTFGWRWAGPGRG